MSNALKERLGLYGELLARRRLSSVWQAERSGVGVAFSAGGEVVCLAALNVVCQRLGIPCAGEEVCLDGLSDLELALVCDCFGDEDFGADPTPRLASFKYMGRFLFGRQCNHAPEKIGYSETAICRAKENRKKVLEDDDAPTFGMGREMGKRPSQRAGVDHPVERITQAAISVQRKKGNLPAHLQTIVDKVVKPQLNWKMLLRRFVTSAYGGSRRWLPPSRRHVWHGLYLQSMRDERLKACVAVDTSGSCVGDLPQFFSELSALLGSFGNYEITVVQCDDEIGRIEVFTSDCPLPKNYGWKVTGGGGTTFVPVFDYIEKHGMRPDVFVYVTDGYGDAPAKAPPYPVMWVLTADATEDFVPWGMKLRLNPQGKAK